ncbi:MAG: biotin--[acetyl-CoA-carboxylase] ligase [Acidimicrobiia bacterium]|nr:biotin--[acetyl-CoA-carboxylase] ligase [Acidimicrobiia bacterium]
MEETASTQDEARRRFAGFPLLVVAARQTAGRGRRGRAWETAPRALAATLALRLAWPEATWPRLTLVAGLAACRALGPGVGLEWPNDLVQGSRKIGGLLTEAAGDVVAVGLGVNLHWPAPTVVGAGALYVRDPGAEAAERLAQAWARELLRRVAAGPEAWGREEYAGCCATLGREVIWEPGGRGRAAGVAADGGLEVETASGHRVLHAGEVHTVRFV